MTFNELKALQIAKNGWASFDYIATIGRQWLHINPKKLSFLKLSKEEKEDLKQEEYVEKLLKILGSKNIDSFDYSGYENATFIHDMSQPIDTIHKNKYDLVFDGGTLEHVFNFPVAIKNCMEMVKVGWYFISVTVCNNFSGHGFYQFSPELFFRIFSEENGYETKDIFLSEKSIWYRVKDPLTVKKRVTFKNRHETYMIVIAEKKSESDIFKTYPLQSDYVDSWNGTDWNKESLFQRIMNRLRREFIKYDKRFFEKIKIWR